MSSSTSRQEATRGSRARPIGGSGRVSACSAAAAPPPPDTCIHESTFGSERRGPALTSMPAARRSASVRLAVTEGGDSMSSCAAALASSSSRLRDAMLLAPSFSARSFSIVSSRRPIIGMIGA